jgi:hypothetical protein
MNSFLKLVIREQKSVATGGFVGAEMTSAGIQCTDYHKNDNQYL